MKKLLRHSFTKIISRENLFEAWREFIVQKRHKQDVGEFALDLIDNIDQLHTDLNCQTYRHGGYESFHITDPKPRHIHKASVRDRLLHHAIHRQLYPFFDNKFIADSYSCRANKGTHKAFARFAYFSRKVSRNNTKTCWVLKCDIRKFFASIDQIILKQILAKHIEDEKVLWLLRQVIDSFSMNQGKGLPLGNLTSQLLVNIYMNELDQYVKNDLRVRYYIRYADDFVLLSEYKEYVKRLVISIDTFLKEELGLQLHPQKVSIETVASGVDFLGWVHFPHYRTLRTATRRRMMKRAIEYPEDQTLQSYLGLLSHGNAYMLKKDLLNNYYLFS